MARKRADLEDGGTDQLTVRLPKSRFRLASYAIPDMACWLLMHHERYMRQAVALEDAARHGADCSAGAHAAVKSANTISQLIASLSLPWSLRDWHEAQSLVCNTLANAGIIPVETHLDKAAEEAGQDGG